MTHLYDSSDKQKQASDLLMQAGFNEVAFGGDCLNLTVAPERLHEALTYARDHEGLQLKALTDVTAVDRPGEAKRFQVVYHLLSIKLNLRLRVKVDLSERESVPSAVPVFSSAGWFEREVWDMFGIRFSGHPDLRRILSDYGFQGHPLRKDFPLSGYVEVRYDPTLKRVIYEPVKLDQEFRFFDTLSPWHGVAEAAAGKKS